LHSILLHSARLAAMGLLLVRPPANAAAADAQEFAVAKTFNNEPFRYRMEPVETRKGFQILRVTYPSPVVTPVVANNTVPADYYLPDGIAPDGPGRPAVIVIHILNGNYELERMLCSSLAARGIPAVMFKLPYYGERGLPGGRKELTRNPALFVEALPQGIQDARRLVDLLASRPEVDPRRIGVAGISLGGLVSATAAGMDPRLARTALILAGGDLWGIIHHCREARDLSQFIDRQPPEQKARIQKAIAEVDPLRYAAGLRDRALAGKVLMVNATEDNVIPRPSTDKLAAALGIADKVVWLEGLGHYTAIAALPQTLRRTVDFFALDMPPGVTAPESRAGSTDPVRTVAEMVKQIASLLVVEPAKGRCHLVDAAASVTDKGGKSYEGRLRFVRGSGFRFRLELKAPVVGEVSLGQDDRPWMASAKTVFRGVKNVGPQPRNPLEGADPKYLNKVRTLAIGFSGIVLAPSMLDSLVDVKDDSRAGEDPAIRISTKDHKQNSARIVLDRDRKRPTGATFAVDGVRGKITFHAWEFDTVAPEQLFQPPSGLNVKEVDEADLHRIFSAMFDFAMELAE
jgi:dienelactone hydrolase